MKVKNKELLFKTLLLIILVLNIISIILIMFRIEHILQNQIFRTNERIDIIEERLDIE